MLLTAVLMIVTTPSLIVYLDLVLLIFDVQEAAMLIGRDGVGEGVGARAE